ncbi:MAG TPA: hypothetical protein VK513_16950, partial [Terriglobales bacterium]|nr:hypothetical protein [Terriglobales bacterium]
EAPALNAPMPSKILPLLEASMMTVFTWPWTTGVADEHRSSKNKQRQNFRCINLRGQFITNAYSLVALFAWRSV